MNMAQRAYRTGGRTETTLELVVIHGFAEITNDPILQCASPGRFIGICGGSALRDLIRNPDISRFAFGHSPGSALMQWHIQNRGARSTELPATLLAHRQGDRTSERVSAVYVSATALPRLQASVRIVNRSEPDLIRAARGCAVPA
jgi:hypothetical protein